MHVSVKIGLIASMILLFTVNLVLLDVALLYSRMTTPPSEIAATTVRVNTDGPSADTCNVSCQTGIDALNRKIEELSQRLASSALSLPQGNGSAKEYFVPLGSGTAKSSVWQEIIGAEALIDASYYPDIKSVTFEVFMKIPTANGTVKAKLYNVTDQHDVWFSEVSSEGSALTKKEASITLEQGAKTYRVMGLSTLKYDANVENARLRIVTY